MKYRKFALAVASGFWLWTSQTHAADPSAELGWLHFQQQPGAYVRFDDSQSEQATTDPPALLGDATGAEFSLSDGVEGCCEVGGQHYCGRWGQVEALLWWTRQRDLPPLVTTSPNGTARAQAGVLPDATVLFGDEEVGDVRAGGRYTIGQWLVQDCYAATARFWFLNRDNEGFAASSDGDPILARPFFNVSLGQEDAQLIAFPGVTTGTIHVRSSNDILGTDLLMRKRFIEGCGFRIDTVGGYQFIRIDDSLVIDSLSVSQDPGGTVPIGTTFDVLDAFETDNHFHGGQAGLLMEFYRGRCTIDVLAKVGFGYMLRSSTVDGSTVTTEPGGAVNTFQGGLLTQQTNMGTFEDDELSFIPELNLNLKYSVNDCVDLGVGYTFIYFNDVVLAGDQVDRSVNLTQQQNSLVGEARPAQQFNDTDFWAQGLNFSVSIGY